MWVVKNRYRISVWHGGTGTSFDVDAMTVIGCATQRWSRRRRVGSVWWVFFVRWGGGRNFFSKLYWKYPCFTFRTVPQREVDVKRSKSWEEKEVQKWNGELELIVNDGQRSVATMIVVTRMIRLRVRRWWWGFALRYAYFSDYFVSSVSVTVGKVNAKAKIAMEVVKDEDEDEGEGDEQKKHKQGEGRSLELLSATSWSVLKAPWGRLCLWEKRKGVRV
jgi:hypothetical protein